jgi:SAM-dependent methyltransferase
MTLAGAVGPTGSVVATDLSPNTLAATREQVRRAGLGDRVEVRVADMERLPFDDGEFDGVSCRLGIMFVPDVQRALLEIRRVLRPGGRASFVVWGSPMDQGWSGTMMATFGRYVELPGCVVGVPTPWRFADAGPLAEALSAAGFEDVVEDRRAVEMPWPGDGADFWQYVRATAAPARQVLRENPLEVVETAVADVIAAWETFRVGDRLVMPGSIGVASGRR